MRLAITGAAGFLGGHLLRLAQERGHEVLAVLRGRHGAPDGTTVLRAELGEDRAELAEAFAGLDAVLHAAGRVAGGSAAEFARDNPDATGEVARAALAAGLRMVHVSSTAVYGDRAPELGPVREDAPFGYRVDAWDRYATAKIDAELRLRVFEGLDLVVVRPGFIIGPGDRNTGPLLDLLGGVITPLVGRGHNRLPLTSVASVADAILRAAEAPVARGRSYNIAGDWPVTQRSFYAALAATRGLRPRLVPLPYRAFLAAGLAADALASRLPIAPPWSRSAAALLGLDADFPTERARTELGWSPALTLQEAVAAAVG